MRYKVWRSNKDKELHLLCCALREGREVGAPSDVERRGRERNAANVIE
jgi:hypothetical protein